jgi:hypothetical protein
VLSARLIGIAHGNALNRYMNNDIYSTLNGNSVSKITGGTVNDGKSYQYTSNDIFNARAQVEAQRGRPDTLLTYPYAAAIGGGSTSGFYFASPSDLEKDSVCNGQHHISSIYNRFGQLLTNRSDK